MISPNMPPITSPGFAGAAGHARPGAETEVTPDMIEMGSQLGCPFLASMKKPEFGATEEAGCDGANLCRSNTMAGASAAVAGGFGLAGVAGACPHMSSNNTNNSDQTKQQQQQ